MRKIILNFVWNVGLYFGMTWDVEKLEKKLYLNFTYEVWYYGNMYYK